MSESKQTRRRCKRRNNNRDIYIYIRKERQKRGYTYGASLIYVVDGAGDDDVTEGEEQERQN